MVVARKVVAVVAAAAAVVTVTKTRVVAIVLLVWSQVSHCASELDWMGSTREAPA